MRAGPAAARYYFPVGGGVFVIWWVGGRAGPPPGGMTLDADPAPVDDFAVALWSGKTQTRRRAAGILATGALNTTTESPPVLVFGLVSIAHTW